ncbi:MAG: ATP-binding protein [Spirochaetota bacterium]
MNGNEHILQLPDNLNDIYAFDKVISMEDELYAGRAGVLDLGNITFIEPYSMLGLLLIGKRFLKNTGTRLKLINPPVAVLQYLYRMDFFNTRIFLTDEDLESSKRLSRSAFSRRVIEVTEIPNAERESVAVISRIVSLFRKRASYILRHWFSDDSVNYFVTVISEICQNVFEHSMDNGYLALQTYTYNRDNVVRLAIADSGIGIEESFSEKQRKQFGHGADLLKNALTKPISGKREFGYGLCRVNSIIREMKGNLFVRSRSSSVAFVYNKGFSDGMYCFQKNDLEYFDGTQISISLYG